MVIICLNLRALQLDAGNWQARVIHDSGISHCLMLSIQHIFAAAIVNQNIVTAVTRLNKTKPTLLIGRYYLANGNKTSLF